jgi:hypothetical protein
MSFFNPDLRQEGIFRKTGSVSRQNELKYLVNQLKPLNLDSEYTAHDVASVLKSFLNDLPEPILSEVKSFFLGVDPLNYSTLAHQLIDDVHNIIFASH